jgi:zeaxanthin glucosyltransferase
MHFGIICPPVPGHLHPFGALGRELIGRGHRVTFLNMADVEIAARSEGLDFRPIGQSDHPAGSLPLSLSQLGKLQGLAALRFTIRAVKKTTEMICRDAPEAIRAAGIDVLLVDQTEPAGGTVADHLGLPFLTVCNALALNQEPSVPPPFSDWTNGAGWWRGLRNSAGYAVSGAVMSPVTRVIASYRQRWNLPAHRTPEDSFSQLAQISQQPPAFDFPRTRLPSTFHYCGPLRNASGINVPFPWERLDGRPLIYASLGTLQYSKENLFRCFAEAASGLDVQLAISHCGGLTQKAIDALPGKPIVVNYAPQREVLQRAKLALTHAGLNTVLDALTYGVPVMAVPITFEQPAIAARVHWAGAGRALPLRGINAQTLRENIAVILNDPSYARKAQRIADSIRQAGGVAYAADVIENIAKRLNRAEKPAD